MGELPSQPPAAPGLSPTRKFLALGIALASDTVGAVAELAPPAQWLIDALTAALLFAVLGFRWSLLPVLAVECVPVLGLFPTWTLAAGALVATSKGSSPTSS